MYVLKNIYRRYKNQSPYTIFCVFPNNLNEFSLEKWNKHTFQPNIHVWKIVQKCPKIAILGPSEYVEFDIPYVHIRTYIFKKLNWYVNQLFPFICVENPVCFLVCYVCKNNPKTTVCAVYKISQKAHLKIFIYYRDLIYGIILALRRLRLQVDIDRLFFIV